MVRQLFVISICFAVAGCNALFGPDGWILKDKSRAYTEAKIEQRIELPHDSPLQIDDYYPVPEADKRLAPTKEKFEAPKPPSFIVQRDEIEDISEVEVDKELLSIDYDGNGFPIMSLPMSFAEAWIVVGEALGKSEEIIVSDRDRTLAIYYLKNVSGNKKDRKKEFQLKLTHSANAVLVSLLEDVETMAPSKMAQRVLDELAETIAEK